MPRLGDVMGGILWCYCSLPVFGAVLTERFERAETSAEFITRIWQREHGLPDNSIRALLQTHDGYLWMGTSRGLVRFDGLKLTVWDRQNTPALTVDEITCLAEDTVGNVWIGTTDGMVRKSGSQFTHFVQPIPVGQNRTVHALCPRKRGGMWIGVRHGLIQFTDGRFIRHGTDKDWEWSGAGALYEDPMGVVWIGVNDGLRRFDPERSAIERVHPGGVVPEFPVEWIAPAVDGGLWALFYHAGRGGFLHHLHGGKWRPVSEALGAYLSSVFLCPTRGGDLWVSPRRGAMDRYRDGRFTRFPLSMGGADTTAQIAIEDSEGSLWIGSEQAGLCRWQPRKVRSYTTQDGLIHDNVWTICESSDGSVWVGTEGGLSCYRDGSFTNLTTKQGLPRNVVRALAEDRAGRMWIGTGSGLVCLQDGQLVQHYFAGDWFSSKVRALLFDRLNHLWVATAHGLHRVRLPDNGNLAGRQGDGRVATNQVVTWLAADGLPHNDVSALLEDRSGTVWVGTSGGLCCWRDGRMTSPSGTNGLTTGNVSVLHEDEDGAIWIGAERTLYRYRDGRFTPFTPREGLFDDIINSILEDEHGYLWFGGDRGICRIAKTALDAVALGRASRVTPVVYSEADGLLSQETNGQKNQPAACRTRAGKLWFPTTKGVLVLDPKALPDNTHPPPAVIEQVRANGRVVFSDGPESQLRLPPSQTHFLEIQYTANSFVAPERMRFKYRLDGLDKDWIDAGPRRSAFYTDVRPGSYHFRVVAANSHGVWNETGASLAIHLAPYFYQTMLFKVGCGFAVALLAGGIYRWRVTELRKIQRLEQQSALTAERARMAKDLHDGLGANLTQLTLMAELAERESPAAVGQRVRSLAASSREVTRSLKDFLWAAHPADETLEGLVARICQHAEGFLGDAGVRCRFELPDQLPPRALSPTTRQNLFLAAKEALNNVAKHANATEVRIRAATENGLFTLDIEDAGRGFDPERFACPSQAVDRGRGLGNMRSRVEEAGGQFTLESRLDSGTRIRIQLPIPPAEE